MATTASRNNTNTTSAQSTSNTSSPRDSKKALPKKDETPTKDSPAQSAAKSQSTSPRLESAASVTKGEGGNNEDNKNNTNATQPLAPPLKPSQQQNSSETSDYFSAGHNSSHFSLEPNPFEQSFGNPSSETPGRFPGLPSVASLTSPAPLGPGGTPGWQLGNSLRSGPLSPAMLPGPTNATGYFDEQFRQSFPTPNESSLRTGLTPGGGGSMFPAPSPNSQAIFNSMQSGLATPGTLDFQRTAMNAAARSKVEANNHNQPMGPTPQGINKQDYQPAQQAQMGHQDPFGNHPDRDAVNSLYMLAQTGNRNANQFAVPTQPQGLNMNGSQGQQRVGSQQHDTSPTAGRGSKQSIGSLEESIISGEDYGSDGSLDNKPATKAAKGKRGQNGKGAQGGNSRRKADDASSKASANKRAKNNSGAAMNMSMSMSMMEGEDSDDDIKDEMIDTHPNGKKMTDEEKRKNFLERNRVAALKCRQRKKQWLANLQAKVEIFTSENDALNSQNSSLREEIVNLKTLLIQHKDCAVSHQQGLNGATMQQIVGVDFNPNTNPYGMGIQNGGQMGGPMMQMHPGQGMQRR